MAKTYKMTLDFKGKDSVMFKQEYEIPENVYNLIKDLQAGKVDTDKIFDVNSTDVGNFMKEACQYATPKLFRTSYGCRLLVEELQRLEREEPLAKNATVVQKMAQYDKACLAVTKKLNHQRNVSKNFDAQMEKIDETIKAAINRETEVQKKATEDLKKLQKQIKAAKATLTGEKLEKTLESYKEKKVKIDARVLKAQNKIKDLEIKKNFKGETANFAISTARTNYSSPKIAYSWAKDHDVPISKIYSKALAEKFSWAENTPADYWKKFPNVKD